MTCAVLRLASARAEKPRAVVMDTASCAAPRGAAAARAGTATSAHAAPSWTLPWTHPATCLRSMSRLPMPTTVPAAAELARVAQDVTGQSVELAYVDQGHASERPVEAHGIRLEAVKLHKAKRGFVPLPRRWVIERSFAWAARCRRLARDHECLPETLAGLHVVAFVLLMLRTAADLAMGPYQPLRACLNDPFAPRSHLIR